MHKFRSFGGLGLTAVLLLLYSCGGGNDPAATEPPAAPIPGGTLVLGIASDIERWNPYLSSRDTTFAVLRRIYLPLADPPSVSANPDQEPTLRKRLASSWQRSNDGLAITIQLRDLLWSDGVPITAEDVRFTWKSQIADEVGWTNSDSKRWIENVEALDMRTVRFQFSRRYPYQLIDALDGLILPAHVFGKVPLADWAEYDWSQAQVGSGPFLPAEHRRGERIRLRRNPKYGEPGLPRVDELVFLIVPDPTARTLRLRAGEIDAATALTPRDAQALERADGITATPRLVPLYDFIAWNSERPPLDDPKVRRGLTHAINRQALVDDLLYGEGTVAVSPIPNYHWASAPGLPDPGYDLAAAEAELVSAGLVRGPDKNWLFHGELFAPELITSDSSAIRRDVLVRVQQQLAVFGVPAKIRTLESGALRKTAESGSFDAFIGGWFFFGNPDLTNIFGVGGSQNFTGYVSQEFEALRPAVHNAESTVALQEALAEMQRVIVQDQPYSFLYVSRSILAIGPRVRGLSFPDPLDPWGSLEEAWLQP